MTNFFESIEDKNFILGLNGKWGNGKTTFIKMWQAYLKQKGFTTIYFNAWENDLQDNPFLAILSHLKQTLKKKAITNWENLAKTGKRLVKEIMPHIFKLLITDNIDLSEIQTSINKIKDELYDETLEEYENKKKYIEEFRNALKDFSKQFDKSIIFFIDELDRSRPNFAIQLLEKIKHFFNVDNFIFVIAIDKIQLSNSIKAVYGNEFDSDNYLERFFDLLINLPEGEIYQFCKDLLKKYHLKLDNDDREDFIKFSEFLFMGTSVSYRLIEKYYTQFGLIQYNMDKIFYLELILFFIVLRNRNFNLYTKIKNKKCDYNEILKYLKNLSTEFKYSENILQRRDIKYFIGGIIVYIEKYIYQVSSKLSLENILEKTNKGIILLDTKIKIIVNDFIDDYNKDFNKKDKDIIKIILEKIELSSQFITI